MKSSLEGGKRKEKAELLEKGFTYLSLFMYSDALLDLTLGWERAYLVAQPIFIVLYLITAYLIYRDRRAVISLLGKSALILALMLLPLLSTFWSEFPATTLRRGFALLQTSLFGVYLGTRYSTKELMVILRNTLGFILLLSAAFILFLPSYGIHQDIHAGAFRGIFIHKNTFGSRMALSSIVFFLVSLDKTIKSRRLNLIFFGLAVALTFLSRSSTAFAGLILTLGIVPFLYVPKWDKSKLLPGVLGIISILFFSILFAVENFDSLLTIFGEDSTLTGRTGFWPILIEAIQQRFWVGYGYHGYWSGGLDSPSAILEQTANVFGASHAHNGFLDIFLSVGFIGFACFFVTLWSAFLNFLMRLRQTQSPSYFFPLLFFIFFLSANFVVTSIYTFNNLMWSLYICLLVGSIRVGLRRPTRQFDYEEPIATSEGVYIPFPVETTSDGEAFDNLNDSNLKPIEYADRSKSNFSSQKSLETKLLETEANADKIARKTSILGKNRKSTTPADQSPIGLVDNSRERIKSSTGKKSEDSIDSSSELQVTIEAWENAVRDVRYRKDTKSEGENGSVNCSKETEGPKSSPSLLKKKEEYGEIQTESLGLQELVLSSDPLDEVTSQSIRDLASSARITQQEVSEPRSSLQQTNANIQIPVFPDNNAFLRVSNLELVVNPNASIIKRLEAAELIDSAQVASVQTTWKQEGGLVADLLLRKTGLKVSTLNFFSDPVWKEHLSKRKRIGEYLQEAQLVTKHDVQTTLDRLKKQPYKLPLGVALAKRGLIRQTTADYLARSLVQRSQRVQPQNNGTAGEVIHLLSKELVETPEGYLICVVTLWGRLESKPTHQIRQNLLQTAKLHSPNILLDMTLVKSIDMASIGAIISAANMCRALRGQLCICGLSEEVKAFLLHRSLRLGIKSYPDRRMAIAQFSFH